LKGKLVSAVRNPTNHQFLVLKVFENPKVARVYEKRHGGLKRFLEAGNRLLARGDLLPKTRFLLLCHPDPISFFVPRDRSKPRRKATPP